jgi:integration host factor subunit beta
VVVPGNTLFIRYSMLKKDLVDKVSSELSMQKQDVSLAVDIMLATMASALVEERRIELRGFGSFSVRSRKPRSTKNPRTGKIMEIPDRKTLHFTMSKSLKEALISEKD